MKKKYKYAVIFGAAAVAVALVVRIRWVNADRHEAPVETYAMGEEVALEDNYTLEEYEIAEDYVITVNSAKVSSLEEFLEKYGYTAADIDTLFPAKDMTYPEMVYDVNITVKNVGTEEREDVGINLSFYDLMAIDYKLQINDTLYTVANPHMENGTQIFRLKPHSEMTIELPYYFSVSAPYSYLTTDEAKSSDMYLVLTMYPTEKRILVREK